MIARTLTWLWLSAFLAAGPLVAQEPLHERIDEALGASFVGPASARASDAQFLRRAWLDLTGSIPTAEEARAFLSDPGSDKRARLIDRLIATPEHARHLAETFDVAWMERRPAANVDGGRWRQYLYDSFAAGKPYRQLVAEALAADGANEADRHLARFTLDREGESHRLARDVGRIFFGRDLQCAQCHDHPLIGGYRQSEYHNLRAFLARTTLFKTKIDKDKERSVLADRAEGDDTFKSVFRPRIVLTATPSLPLGAAMPDPVIAAEELYTVKPDQSVRGVPKYSRRLKLAEVMGTGTSRPFARTLANRLWAVTMGRGLVEPLDLDHPGNPPSHPRVLELLTDAVIAADYRVDEVIRELLWTQAYQRSADLPGREGFAAGFTGVSERLAAQEAELAKASQVLAAAEEAFDAVEKGWEESRLSTVKLAAAKVESASAVTAAQAAREAAAKALAESRAALEAKTKAKQAIAEAAEKAKAAVAAAADKPELAQAAATFSAAVESTAAEIVAMEKVVAERTAAMESSAQSLGAAEQKLAGATGDLAKAEEESASRSAALDSAYESRGAAQTAAKLAERRTEGLALLAAYRDRSAALDAAKADQVALQTKLDESRSAMAAMVQSLAEHQAAAEKSEALAARAAEALEDTRRHVATLEKAIGALKQAVAAATSEPLAKDLADLMRELEEARVLLASRGRNSEAAQAARAECRRQLDSTTGGRDSLAASVASWGERLAECSKKIESCEWAAGSARESLAPFWSRHQASRPLRPLTAEQLAWATMRATGITAMYEDTGRGELNRVAEMARLVGYPVELPPPSPREVERYVERKLRGIVDSFVHYFGAGPGQDPNAAQPTVEQALFMANGGTILSWVKPSGENLAARLVKIEDPALVAEELYLSVLTRYPDREEAERVREFLESRKEDRPGAAGDMIWGLLASTEFRFNH